MNCAISHGYLTFEFMKTAIVLRAKQVIPVLVPMSRYIICLLRIVEVISIIGDFLNNDL